MADTVALAHYFTGDLPAAADRVFREAEEGRARILVPEVVIGEFVYIALKGRLKVSDPTSIISELLEEVGVSGYMSQTPMDLAAWTDFLGSRVPELHDRMIAAIASSRSALGVITNDRELRSLGIPTVW